VDWLPSGFKTAILSENCATILLIHGRVLGCDNDCLGAGVACKGVESAWACYAEFGMPTMGPVLFAQHWLDSVVYSVVSDVGFHLHFEATAFQILY
jgi:hypothetical protein